MQHADQSDLKRRCSLYEWGCTYTLHKAMNNRVFIAKKIIGILTQWVRGDGHFYNSLRIFHEDFRMS